MKNIVKALIQDSIDVKNKIILDEALIGRIEEAARAITTTARAGGKILIFGNGGSAADSQHFAAELIGRFEKERESVAALALSTDTSVLSAIGNDYGFEKVFERQIEGLGRPADLVFAISTSGNARNVLAAVRLAKKMGLKTIGLTGHDGAQLAKDADIPLAMPSGITARIQEAHILIIHIICKLVEETLGKP